MYGADERLQVSRAYALLIALDLRNVKSQNEAGRTKDKLRFNNFLFSKPGNDHGQCQRKLFTHRRAHQRKCTAHELVIKSTRPKSDKFSATLESVDVVSRDSDVQLKK